ncbi:MAG: hypothetical protein V1790_12595 [Planctomycetota bacterium]
MIAWRTMKPDDIRAHLRLQPFQPIRVYISDGSKYEVRPPELMPVTKTEVVIAIDPGDDGIPERKVFCDPVHITRIEPVNGTKRKPQGK